MSAPVDAALRAVVDAAVAYVRDRDGESDDDGLDASERLSEAVCALPDRIPPAALGRLSPTAREVVRIARRLTDPEFDLDTFGTALDVVVECHLAAVST